MRFTIIRDPKALAPLLPEIQKLADAEKDALGFLPAQAFREAVEGKRLIAATTSDNGHDVFAGYLLLSGIFPHAKVQQITAAAAYRRKGAASALMRALVADLERLGYISIRADVASDLPAAQAFYTHHGFQQVRERPGGAARKRTICVLSKTLDTDTLFTSPSLASAQGIEARSRYASIVPVFAFDLNVFFDLVRERDQSENARRLFAEALGHTVRLAVADEFVTELRKKSHGLSSDPILQMALQLPRLPKAQIEALDRLADQIHEVVFIRPQHKDAGTDRAKSDAKHVAHAALSKAAAFITRDGPILKARQQLLEVFGIDVATPAEVIDLLPADLPAHPTVGPRGDGFREEAITAAQFAAYCHGNHVSPSTFEPLCKLADNGTSFTGAGIICDERLAAVGAIALPKGVDSIARALVHVRHEQPDAETLADYLIDKLIRAACRTTAGAIELAHLPGQSIVHKAAIARGFHKSREGTTYTKIAVGKPLTRVNWNVETHHVRRRTSLVLPADLTSLRTGTANVTLPSGAASSIPVTTLEGLLGPTLIVWPGRNGVIVPIARHYADDLLGTSDQPTLAFLANKDAAFLSLRGYVNSPRTAALMQPGAPIVFYESKRNRNGRGAAVAVARIANSVVVAKSQLDPKSDKRLVIDDASGFSATDDVLVTTFDNLMTFPKPVPLRRLKALNATGQANLVTASRLTSDQLTVILSEGWAVHYDW